MASTSLTVTVAHAIAYITRPLLLRSSTETLLTLQLALEASLKAYYASSWNPSEPLRGSGRRCLTLSPTAIPPRPIYVACRAANVEWVDWIAALGGVEFDLFVDPGCVSVRLGRMVAGPFSKLITVWSEELSREQQVTQAQALEHARLPLSPAFIQKLQHHDDEDEQELFAMLADELAAPTWKTPKCSQFPTAPCRMTRSTASQHSRSSSSSSASDDDYSIFDDDSDSVSSVTTASSVATDMSKLSRRERARLARIVIDKSKTDVTNYDGGKTTVLTGGVMLGAPAKPKVRAAPKPIAQAPVFVPKLSAPPKASSAPWIRQPFGPTPGLTWRIRA